jgi:hypothetical protein
MNTDNTDQKQRPGKHDSLTERIIGVFYDAYNELGYGFLELVYREGNETGTDAGGYEGEYGGAGELSRKYCWNI